MGQTICYSHSNKNTNFPGSMQFSDMSSFAESLDFAVNETYNSIEVAAKNFLESLIQLIKF